jgi:AcrR family transcriptional regulator
VTAASLATSPARRLAELTLSLIERTGGLRQVNLREVARLANCSHTNVYNYFGSFEDLLWATLDLAIERLVAHTESAMEGQTRPEGMFRVFIDSQVEFALSHPGCYRFIWLEGLSGTPPAQVAERIQRTSRLFAETVRNTVAPTAKPATVERAARIIHGYLHGEICKLICARLVGPMGADQARQVQVDRARKTIRSDVQRLAKQLVGP